MPKYIKVKEHRWWGDTGRWWIAVQIEGSGGVGYRMHLDVGDEQEADYFLQHPDKIEPEYEKERRGRTGRSVWGASETVGSQPRFAKPTVRQETPAERARRIEEAATGGVGDDIAGAIDNARRSKI